jgi:hypothetical protein
VRIAVGNGQVEATGLIADLAAEHISLESGVSGRIAP